MSAYKEKMLAEKRIAEINREIAVVKHHLHYLLEEKEKLAERLAEAEQDIKWEAQNDR